MKKNIILSFILVAFIAALCVTIMNIDEYYLSSFSSVESIGIAEVKHQETVTRVNTDRLDTSNADNDMELVKMQNY